MAPALLPRELGPLALAGNSFGERVMARHQYTDLATVLFAYSEKAWPTLTISAFATDGRLHTESATVSRRGDTGVVQKSTRDDTARGPVDTDDGVSGVIRYSPADTFSAYSDIEDVDRMVDAKHALIQTGVVQNGA